MANIHETIAEVEKLSPDLAKQIKRYVKDHSYGLVFEQNLPDSVRLWAKKPAKYDTVHILPPRGKFDTEENHKEWSVSDIVDGIATLKCDEEVKFVSVEDIVPVVGHKGVIYPGLKVIDKVERGNPDDPYHVLINAENYHALQMLRYTYAGKVDCIYIDPPYNTGAKDWKYNNDYVGQDDQYRHSKWLAMMERRLKLAKDLLNPDDSVMIVTIDEKEYLRLGMLLEQIFPEARIQMVSLCMNPAGSSRKNQFSRTDEYYYFVELGKSAPLPLPLSSEWSAGNKSSAGSNKLLWESLKRRGADSFRIKNPNQFYPIFVTEDGKKIIKIGDSLPLDKKTSDVKIPEGCKVIFPYRSNGEEGLWQLSPQKCRYAFSKGYIKLGSFDKVGGMSITYLKLGEQKKVENGVFTIVGRNEDGSIITNINNTPQPRICGTQWRISSHNASTYGTPLVANFIGRNKFQYPKSLYAVEDSIRFFVSDKPNALIVDFFAGSGTTAHAIMLLNHLDGGHRLCISVTNNEIGPDNEKALIKQGLRPTDKDWQDKGIAHYITWERIKSAITGIATDGKPVKGDYKFTEEFPMAEGFKENAIFCELTYEKLWDIRLDRAFNMVAPILWMLAGCKGKIIEKLGKGYATTDNYAVLFKYEAMNKLAEVLKEKPSVEHVFVVTDDQQRYTTVVNKLYMVKRQNIHRLYESYLKSFEIKGEGGLD